MTTTTVFLNNRTQAVRLPKALAFPGDVHEVEIAVVGDARVIAPVGRGWDHWFAHGARVTDDFCEGREQPPMQERDWSA